MSKIAYKTYLFSLVSTLFFGSLAHGMKNEGSSSSSSSLLGIMIYDHNKSSPEHQFKITFNSLASAERFGLSNDNGVADKDGVVFSWKDLQEVKGESEDAFIGPMPDAVKTLFIQAYAFAEQSSASVLYPAPGQVDNEFANYVSRHPKDQIGLKVSLSEQDYTISQGFFTAEKETRFSARMQDVKVGNVGTPSHGILFTPSFDRPRHTTYLWGRIIGAGVGVVVAVGLGWAWCKGKIKWPFGGK